MRAVVVTGPHEVETRDVPEPDGTGKAVVALEQVGICGTDVKIFKGDIPVAYPRVMGHELVGRVRVTGPRRLVPGGTDRKSVV